MAGHADPDRIDVTVASTELPDIIQRVSGNELR